MNRSLLLRLLVDPGWAPIVVAVAFLMSVPSGFAESHDYVFHLAGGAAVAFFAWRSAALVPSMASRIAAHRRPLLAFAFAVIVAALWEAAEFTADGALGTSFQNVRGEALSDFGFSCLGAALFAIPARALQNPVSPDGEPIR